MTTPSDDPAGDSVGSPRVATWHMADDGTFPNNPNLPLILYQGAFHLPPGDPAGAIEQVFQAHQWPPAWRFGVFDFHHYHSTAHEVLGVARGGARVQLGGPEGTPFDVEVGDVLVLPAGVAHKNLGADPHFLVVGAYPEGQDWDLLRGGPGERPEADRNIERVSLPAQDPVYGPEGPLVDHWERSS